MLPTPGRPCTTRGGRLVPPSAGRHPPTPLLWCNQRLGEPCGAERHAGTTRPDPPLRRPGCPRRPLLHGPRGPAVPLRRPTARARPPRCGSSSACWNQTPGRSAGADDASRTRSANDSDISPRTAAKRFFNSTQTLFSCGGPRTKAGERARYRRTHSRHREPPVTDCTTVGWSHLESTAMRSKAWMPPKCTSSLSEPSCSVALV
jgi:hypothetical protein